MKWFIIWSIFLPLSAYAQDIVLRGFPLIVTHAYEYFDEMKGKIDAKKGLDKLIQFSREHGESFVFLTLKSMDGWYTEIRDPTYRYISGGGEFKADILTNTVVVGGGFLGYVESARGCLSSTLADIVISYRASNPEFSNELDIHVPFDAVYLYEENPYPIFKNLSLDFFIDWRPAFWDPYLTLGPQVLPQLNDQDVFNFKGHLVEGRKNPINVDDYTFRFIVSGEYQNSMGHGDRVVNIYVWKKTSKFLSYRKSGSFPN